MNQSGFDESLVVRQDFFRVGGLSRTYFEIVENSYGSFLLDEESRLPKPTKEEDPTERMTQDGRMEAAGLKTIVFAAMCLEAAAYDFAATQLSDAYAQQYLDKLDLLSKWVVVPKLICGKSLKESGPALNGLRTLIRTRNALVHQKSLPFDPEGKNVAAAMKSANAFPGNVHNAFMVVVLLSLELNDLLGVFTTALPSFEKHVRSSRERLFPVQRVIERCRVIHGKGS